MLQNQVRSSFCDFVTVVYIRRLHCRSPVLNCSLLLSSFFPERMFLIFAMSGLWHPPHVCMCLCRYPACVCAFLYTGTTCYSQGWSSLRPVSLCVYSSGGLLPPDYKKDWWINNILLSLALSLTLSEALKLVCARVCVCLCLTVYVCTYMPVAVLGSLCVCACVCVRVYTSISVCDHVCHKCVFVSSASLGGPASPSSNWFLAPLGVKLSQRDCTPTELGTNTQAEGKHPLYPRHQ